MGGGERRDVPLGVGRRPNYVAIREKGTQKSDRSRSRTPEPISFGGGRSLRCVCVCAIRGFGDKKINDILGIDSEEQAVVYMAAVGKRKWTLSNPLSDL